jgi:energy-coupling factor transporter ATP-binding protein EcfA2
MKLSELIRKFEEIDRQHIQATKQVLTPDQAFIFRDILKQMEAGKERYAVLNARSGSGKSTLIRALVKHLTEKKVNVVVTASTGKAASALKGQTIHSYLGLRMVTNDHAESKDEALTLTTDVNVQSIPDVIIIDESSMIGRKVFSAIEQARFPFVFFVLDSSQLPPVKEKRVEWENITNLQYKLTKTLRAQEPRMLKLFEDFKAYSEGRMDSLNLFDYVNGDNIVHIDWNDCDFIPKDSECGIVGYRNKLVEMLVDRLSHPEHAMYNLNTGVQDVQMVAIEDTPNSKGYFAREFVEKHLYYNGEDVRIDKLNDKTKELVERGYCTVKNRKLQLGKKGITVSAPLSCKIPYGASEAVEPKHFISFPPEEILENCTLACINNEHFVLLWDGSEDEYNKALDGIFENLLPHLKIMQTCKKYYKDKRIDLSFLPYDICHKLETSSEKEFFFWFEGTDETFRRKSAWSKFLSASKVVSARKTVARSIHKAQGISVPAICITDDSFYGASLPAQYVAVTRCKHGLILITNTPNDWKEK